MAGDSSFDIVSDFDQQELVNAVDQTRREVTTRYDLKTTKTEITLEKDAIIINTESETSLKGVVDVLETKMVARKLSLKILKPEKMEDAAGGRVRQKILLQRGLTQELAKEITKQIRDQFPKVKPTIQGEAIRVVAKSRDELQAVITFLKSREFPVPLQFENYRS
jgi:cyclic-di-GMP-binding protein